MMPSSISPPLFTVSSLRGAELLIAMRRWLT
jgi:hypothetical protein